jgi:adenosine deaminase/aminodeoxyfutalosine deaminase
MPLPASSIEAFIARLPKAELHVHLEGMVDPATLWTLAERHRTPLYQAGRGALEEVYGTGDFTSFLGAFKVVCEHLREPEDYELVTYNALRRLAGQNVRYAEVFLSAGVMLWKGEDLRSSFEGIEAGYRRAREEFGIRAQWIFDAVRHFGPEAALDVAKAAASLRDRGVIGFSIGGDERREPPESFREVFAYARREGLRLTGHAGETKGPESVWAALRLWGVERIGHGLTAASDPDLVAHLAETQIPLDVSVTSNVRTGCLRRAAEHPVRQYFDRGLLITLNSDDPALFGTNLNQEYVLAHRVLGFTPEELERLAQNSFRAAFLPPVEKGSYLASFPPTICPVRN